MVREPVAGPDAMHNPDEVLAGQRVNQPRLDAAAFGACVTPDWEGDRAEELSWFGKKPEKQRLWQCRCNG